MKKVLSFVLALCMICTLLPATVLTASAEEASGTIDFASTAHRVSQDANSQVWSNGGVTFTNNKANSGTNVANYSNPVRIYAKSEIVFEAPGNITKIVVVVNASKYITALTDSTMLGTATTNGNTVTITPDSSASTLTIPSVSAQTRFSSLTIYYNIAESAYTIDAVANGNGTVELNGNMITATPDEGYEIGGYTVLSGTATVTRNDDVFTVDAESDCQIQINFVKREEKTATFIANGAEYDSVTDYANESITAPDYDGAVVEGYSFAGWVTDEVEETTDAQEMIAAGGKYVLSDNVTFYALFARAEEGGSSAGNSYQKVTGALTTGNYILTYNNMAMNTNTTTKNNKLYRTPVTPNGDIISNPDADIVWTITVNGDTVTICSAAVNKYVKASGSSSTNVSLSTTNTANGELWTVTANGDGTYDFTSKVGGTRALRYHPNNDAWGYYATSNGGPLTLYKAANVTTYYTTSPAPVVKENVAEYTPVDGETVQYTSWDEALNNVTGGTITLLADVTADKVSLNDTVTLDLNGKTLTANTIYATVMDSLDGNGLISTPNKAMLSAVNGQMILWDNNAKGYRVFNYNWSNLDGAVSEGARAEGETVTNRTFWSVLTFDNDKAYQMAGASDLEIGFNVSWTPDDGATSSKYFKFDQSVIIDWGNEQLKNMAVVQGFYVRLTGFEVAATNGKIDVTPVVKTTFTTVATETTSHDYTAD